MSIRHNDVFICRDFVKILTVYAEGRMFGIEDDIGLVAAAIMS